MQFLDDLIERLRPVGIKDREDLLAMKQTEHEELGIPFNGNFYIWDYYYYDRKYIETSLDLDDSVIKEHFPVSVVVPTTLSIYQDLLGVRFEEVHDGSTWHSGKSSFSLDAVMCKQCSLDVQQFSVWDKDAKDQSGFLGYCYLDLYPRGEPYTFLHL